jgi:uncharacterized protein with gpF-like domain
MATTRRQAEARAQQMLLQRLERRFQRRIAAEISAASREMVRVWRITGEVPPDARHRERIAAVYMQMALAAVPLFGRRVQDQGKHAGLRLERKDFAQVMTDFALRYIAQEEIRRRITAVAETTRSDIVRAVAQGFAEGLGQDAIASFVIDQLPIRSRARAALIARTETHGAAGAGAHQAAKQTGLRLKKEWLAADDERTRQAHAEADGAIVDVDQPFIVGGEALMYPGDPSGSAGNVINCRCVAGYIAD